MSYIESDIAQRLKNLKPGESIEVGGLTGQRQPSTNEAPRAEWEYGLATQSSVHSSGQRIEQRVTPVTISPGGLPAPLEGSESSFEGETYPKAAQPLSQVHTQPNAGRTIPRRAQPESTVGS